MLMTLSPLEERQGGRTSGYVGCIDRVLANFNLQPSLRGIIKIEVAKDRGVGEVRNRQIAITDLQQMSFI